MKRLKIMRILKNTTLKLYIVFILIAGVSCQDELDLTPETQISDANFWNSTSDLEKAANYLYSYLPVIYDANDNMGVFSYSNNGANSVSDGTRITPATDGSWNGNYRLIRACNNILEKAEGISGDEETINKYLAEAKFFRAWAYADLLKKFGGVPLITQTLASNSEELFAPRSDRETILELVYSDLDFAASKLTMPGAQSSAEYGRITSTAALALKSRIALFEGTRAKFHNYGNPDAHLQLAVNAAQEIIAGGEHQLFIYPDEPELSYRKQFHDVGDGRSNPEAILVRLYAQNASNNLAAHRMTESRLNQGYMVPTRQLADLYLYIDGLPMSQSSLAKPQENSLTQFEDRDPRIAMTIFSKNEFYSTGTYYQPGFNFSPTGYKFCKYFDPTHFSPPDTWVDYQIIRYAEVLLNYAEAKFELNGSIDDTDLDMTINLIRSRAGMPALTNEFVEANGLDMQTEIRRERSVELANEGFNYWDLIRWKTAELELPQTIYGARYFLEEYGETANRLDENNFVIVQSESDRFFDPAKDYLWPLPLQEIGLNPALEQNPNW